MAPLVRTLAHPLHCGQHDDGAHPVHVLQCMTSEPRTQVAGREQRRSHPARSWTATGEPSISAMEGESWLDEKVSALRRVNRVGCKGVRIQIPWIPLKNPDKVRLRSGRDWKSCVSEGAGGKFGQYPVNPPNPICVRPHLAGTEIWFRRATSTPDGDTCEEHRESNMWFSSHSNTDACATVCPRLAAYIPPILAKHVILGQGCLRASFRKFPRKVGLRSSFFNVPKWVEK